jgi:hypothetical protein
VACDSLDGSLQFRVRTLVYGTGEENVEATERTRDDSSKTTQLKALAAPYRFRVTVDAEGLPMIPGRYGPDRVALRRRELLVVRPPAAACPGHPHRSPARVPEALGDSWRDAPPDRRHRNARRVRRRAAREGGECDPREAMGRIWPRPLRELHADVRTTGHFPTLTAAERREPRVSGPALRVRRGCHPSRSTPPIWLLRLAPSPIMPPRKRDVGAGPGGGR